MNKINYWNILALTIIWVALMTVTKCDTLEAKMKLSDDEIRSTILQQCKSPEQCRLLFAIAETESSMNPYAIGPTGDYGLFQFTKAGLQEAQSQCPYLSHVESKDLLGEVALSTQLAICLLNRLSKFHDGNIIEILIAYNAGTYKALKWRDGAKIPSTTRRYVIKVMHKYFEQRRLK